MLPAFPPAVNLSLTFCGNFCVNVILCMQPWREREGEGPMHTKIDKTDMSVQRSTHPTHYNRTAGVSRKKAKPTHQDTLDYIASLVFQLQKMANEVGEQKVARHLQRAHDEALRSSEADAA